MSMTQEELKNKLAELEESVRHVIMSNGVTTEKALYGFLCTARFGLQLAIMHADEYEENAKDKVLTE